MPRKFRAARERQGASRRSPDSMPGEKVPNHVVGNQVAARFAEDKSVRPPIGPGVAASFDGIENHFRAVAAAAIDRACDPCPVVDDDRQLGDKRLWRTAIGRHPGGDRVRDRRMNCPRDAPLPPTAGKRRELVVRCRGYAVPTRAAPAHKRRWPWARRPARSRRSDPRGRQRADRRASPRSTFRWHKPAADRR